MNVRLRVTGRLYNAKSAFPHDLELPIDATIDDALAALKVMSASGGQLSPTALVAISGEHIGTVAKHVSHTLKQGDELLIFSPVAGG